MKQNIKILPLLLTVPLLFSGCGKPSVSAEVSSTVNNNTSSDSNNNSNSDSNSNNSNKNSDSNTEAMIASSYFSDRDFEVGYDEDESAFITLNGDSADCSSNAV